MAQQITKKGARAVTASLDRMAELFQTEYATLGVSKKVADDFALRCDMLADHIEKHAGIRRQALTGDDTPGAQNGGFDPEEIGAEEAGPLEAVDSDEPYMDGEFTQQEHRELRERVESGDLDPGKVTPEPAAPTSGKQAADLRRALQAAVIEGASPRLVKALALAAKVAEEDEGGDEEVEEEEEVSAKKAAEEEVEEEVEVETKKKASHGFNLFA